MSNMRAIQRSHLALHNALGIERDAVNKVLWRQQHGKVWVDCKKELLARKAELVTKDTLTPEEGQELVELESLFPTPLKPTPKQIRATKLLAKSEADITKEEMWEVIKLLGQR